MIFKRIVAGIVDLILLISVAFAPTFIAAEWLPQYMDATAGQPPTPLMGITLLWLASVLFCYFPAFESSAFMATPGKLLMRLKVVRRNGERLTFTQALYRMVFGPLAIWFLPWYRDHFSGGAIVKDR